MTHFLTNGSKVIPIAGGHVQQNLKAGNYIVCCTPQGEFFLEMAEPFCMPTKFYGEFNKNAERIFNTFMQRESTTGVLLTGEKGSGKTLLSKAISIIGLSHGIPTILINSSFSGDSFNVFIQNITQPAIIIFDEFEKNFKSDDQEKLLTLLDGVFPSKTLFIITANESSRLDTNILNRPGRMYYHINYESLSPEFIREYCEDKLINKNHIDSVCRLTNIFLKLNFDMIKAVVEEMNRYDETVFEVLKLLNVKTENEPFRYNSESYVIHSLVYKGVELDLEGEKINMRGNPLSTGTFEYEVLFDRLTDAEKQEVLKNLPPEYADDEYFTIDMGTSDIINVSESGNSITYQDREGEVLLVIKKSTKEKFNPLSLLY